MGITQAVCEVTGGYERLLVSRLRAANITVEVAHPSRLRAFARACDHEAKTDALDARVLARYGQVFSASNPCPSKSEEEREELQQLLRQRRQLVNQRVQERNRLDKGVGRSTRSLFPAQSQAPQLRGGDPQKNWRRVGPGSKRLQYQGTAASSRTASGCGRPS